jgi:hypothetical protein
MTLKSRSPCGIRDAGGLAIAQKLETSGQPDMPESAIASGWAGFYPVARGNCGGNLKNREGATSDAPDVAGDRRLRLVAGARAKWTTSSRNSSREPAP